MSEMKKNNSITSREVDMGKWYSDVCLKAELMDYSRAKGFIIYRPYGYAIWENIQRWLDTEFKKTGHENVYMPVLIPESLLNIEKEHIAGFAPECAVVTKGGNNDLDEELFIRPTSEVLFCDHFKNILNSYRELPLKYNQWCNVVRWEKTTRPFLRGKEFLWQEGHTLHADEKEAREEVFQMLNIYNRMGSEILAFPFTMGRKTDKEKFAGAEETYSIEALMPDGQALQSGTSHYFGQSFAEKFGIKYLNIDNKIATPYQTSWGVSTRLIGSVIMEHGDDNGLVLPPYIAPIQAVIITMRDQDRPDIIERAQLLQRQLSEAGFHVKYDQSNKSAGWKFAEYEMKGVPLRIAFGPRDFDQGSAEITFRYNGQKLSIKLDDIVRDFQRMLQEINSGMYQKASDYLASHVTEVRTYEELKEVISSGKGYAKMMWDGDVEVENRIKAELGATSRCMPFDQTPFADKDPVSGKPAKYVVLFARAY